METLHEALRLIKRQTELEGAMRRPGGIRVTEERELYQLRASLAQFPAAVRAIMETASRMRADRWIRFPPKTSIAFQHHTNGPGLGQLAAMTRRWLYEKHRPEAAIRGIRHAMRDFGSYAPPRHH